MHENLWTVEEGVYVKHERAKKKVQDEDEE